MFAAGGRWSQLKDGCGESMRMTVRRRMGWEGDKQ